jgi:hypothetical protein
MIKSFRKKKTVVDVLVLIVGHKYPDFLSDTADSFDHYNRDSSASYRIAFAIDHNRDCASVLSRRFGEDAVYCSAVNNGWGRGIVRTMAHALDHFQRNGLRWKHLLTIDSDALVVGKCLDRYVELAEEPGVCFVGQKWGGEGPYSSANPGPTEASQRQVRYLAKLGLFAESWNLVDYMVAGPFIFWTRKTLDFLERVGIFPGPSLDAIYDYILFPHDQLTTLVLGIEGHEFRDVGPISMLHCGDVGGNVEWKTGLPSITVETYGEVPEVPEGVAVIHPIRSKKFEEGKVRAFFRKQRSKE